jgi:hypothetical protein
MNYQATQIRSSSDERLGQIAKTIVVQELHLDLRAWALTDNSAWINLASRILAGAGEREDIRTLRPLEPAVQHVNGRRRR